MSCPRTPTTTTSAGTTTPNATPNEPCDASPATPTDWATPSASTPSKPPGSPNVALLTAIFDAAVGGPLCLIDVATASRCYGAHEETKGVSTALFEVSLSLSVSTIRLHGRAERLKKSAGPLGSPCGT